MYWYQQLLPPDIDNLWFKAKPNTICHGQNVAVYQNSYHRSWIKRDLRLGGSEWLVGCRACRALANLAGARVCLCVCLWVCSCVVFYVRLCKFVYVWATGATSSGSNHNRNEHRGISLQGTHFMSSHNNTHGSAMTFHSTTFATLGYASGYASSHGPIPTF